MSKKVKIDNEAGATAVEMSPAQQLQDAPIVALQLEQIHVDPTRNKRKYAMDQTELKSLAESIVSRGQIQPVIVRPANGGGNGATHELLLGFQRVAAIAYAHAEMGVSDLPVLARVLSANDEEAMWLNLDENLRRKDLSVLDVADMIKELHEKGMDFKAVAAKFGKTAAWASVIAKYADFRPNIQRAIKDGKITQTNARELVGLTDEEQDSLVEKILAGTVKSTASVTEEKRKTKKRSGRGRKAAKTPTIKATVALFEGLAAKPEKGEEKYTDAQTGRQKVASIVLRFLQGEIGADAVGKMLERLAA